MNTNGNTTIDNIQIGDYSLSEWEQQAAEPDPATSLSYQDAEAIGLLGPDAGQVAQAQSSQKTRQPQNGQEQGEQGNKLYKALDAVGIEHPDENKEYQQLSVMGTVKDALTSLGVEASHVFMPKDKELQYESQTRVGEAVKYGYRYIAGTAAFFMGGEVLAGIKGLGLAGRGLATVGKLLSGADLIKTGANASKLAKLGAKAVNASFGGAFSGALADFTLYRPEENEGHLADIIGPTDNALIKYLQTDPNDTDLDAKLKNVVEGLITGFGIGNLVEFGAKPLLKNVLRHFHSAAHGSTEAVKDLLTDRVELEHFAKTADLVQEVQAIKSEADASGQEASQFLIDRLTPQDNELAQKMLKQMESGEEIVAHPDGTWDIKINNWEDAYKVSPEEFRRQLLEVDEAEGLRAGDTAIKYQDKAVQHTWVNRGWIGENETLTKANANKIAKKYKDKFQLDNNIKVEFVDGLNLEGKRIEGNTQATQYQGKKKGGQTLPDITIQIDSNAQQPFAVLRGELEHARDIAKNEVPDQSVQHVARYKGMNEGEIAPAYTYKKSVGRHRAVKAKEQWEQQKAQAAKPGASASPVQSQQVQNTLTPQQLRLNFNQAVEMKQSSGEIATGLVNGSLNPRVYGDLETVVSKVMRQDPKIAGFSWQKLAENPEALFAKLEELSEDEDTSSLLLALAKGDGETLDNIVKNEMAVAEILGHLAETGKKIGKNATPEEKEQIISNIKHFSNYLVDVKGGFGRGLRSQTDVNTVLENYGATRLSSWTKEGIQSFAKSIIEEVQDIINLNFTRGKPFTSGEMTSQIQAKLLEREDTRPFMQFILSNEDMSTSYVSTVSKLLANPETANQEAISGALMRLINSSEYDEMFKAAEKAPDKKAYIKTIRDWCDKQGGVTSYYVHNLLSNVGSLARNVASGVCNTLYFPARKILASCDPFVDQATREALGKEGWRTYKGMIQSWNESFQLMKEAFISGNGKLTDIGENTLNFENGKFKGYHELKDFDYYFKDPSKFWEGVQNFHSMMTRAMGATDEWLTQLNYRAICRAKCMQEAEIAAKKVGMQSNETWINEEADRLFAEKFTARGEPQDVEAIYEARTILYQNKLDGTMYNYKTGRDKQMREPTLVMKGAGGLQQAANRNAFMKCIFPFVKTGANILQMALDHNIIYMAASPVQRKLLTASTREGAIARSQCAFGMFSLVLGMGMAFNGAITGSAPSDPKERKALFATGWRPYSFKIGDTYVSYQGYEPLHGALGFAADCANMASTIANEEDEARFQHFQSMILPTFIDNFLDKAAFRTGLSQLSLVFNPTDTDEWQRAMAGTARGFLPDSAFVTNVRSAGTHDVMQPKSFYERVFYRYFPEGWIPMDYRRNVFGEKQSITGLIIGSAGTREGMPEDEEMEYLAGFGYTPNEIDNVISNTGIKLTDYKDSETQRSALDAMKEEMSTITIQGRTLREAIRELVSSEAYQMLPVGVDLDTGTRWGSGVDTKINAVNDVFLMYKQRAKKNIMKNSDWYTNSEGKSMNEAVEDRQYKRLEQLNNLY